MPLPESAHYETANPFLIQFAVREFLTVCLGRRTIVWGGHPTITPMVWAVCEDLGVSYAQAVHLFQSRHFENDFPIENERFRNVTFIAAGTDRTDSLSLLREAMFKGNFESAVFIGGMEGVRDEHRMFSERHPYARTIALETPGGASALLRGEIGRHSGMDFARILQKALGIRPDESRRGTRNGPKPE